MQSFWGESAAKQYADSAFGCPLTHGQYILDISSEITLAVNTATAST